MNAILTLSSVTDPRHQDESRGSCGAAPRGAAAVGRRGGLGRQPRRPRQRPQDPAHRHTGQEAALCRTYASAVHILIAAFFPFSLPVLPGRPGWRPRKRPDKRRRRGRDGREGRAAQDLQGDEAGQRLRRCRRASDGRRRRRRDGQERWRFTVHRLLSVTFLLSPGSHAGPVKCAVYNTLPRLNCWTDVDPHIPPPLIPVSTIREKVQSREKLARKKSLWIKKKTHFSQKLTCSSYQWELYECDYGSVR